MPIQINDRFKDIDALNSIVDKTIHDYQFNPDLGLYMHIVDVRPLELANNSRYTYKAQAKIEGLGSAKSMTIVGFLPGDGTGERPKGDARAETVASKYFPREKKGEAEIYLPIGTAANNTFHPKLILLDEVTFENNNFVVLKNLGVTKEAYDMSLATGFYSSQHDFDFTFIKDHDNKKGFGNPHAILFDKDLETKLSPSINKDYTFAQFAAFIGFNESCKELDILKEHYNNRKVKNTIMNFTRST